MKWARSTNEVAYFNVRPGTRCTGTSNKSQPVAGLWVYFYFVHSSLKCFKNLQAACNIVVLRWKSNQLPTRKTRFDALHKLPISHCHTFWLACWDSTSWKLLELSILKKKNKEQSRAVFASWVAEGKCVYLYLHEACILLLLWVLFKFDLGIRFCLTCKLASCPWGILHMHHHVHLSSPICTGIVWMYKSVLWCLHRDKAHGKFLKISLIRIMRFSRNRCGVQHPPSLKIPRTWKDKERGLSKPPFFELWLEGQGIYIYMKIISNEISQREVRCMQSTDELARRPSFPAGPEAQPMMNLGYVTQLARRRSLLAGPQAQLASLPVG